MKKDGGKCIKQAVFLVYFLFASVSLPLSADAAIPDRDTLISELQRDDRSRYFFSKENLRNEETFSALVELVTSKWLDWRIRIKGIAVLGDSDNPRTPDFLVALFYDLFSHEDCPAMKKSIAAALGNFPGSTRVYKTLAEGLEDNELQVREESIRSLAKIGNGDAVPLIIAKLKDRNYSVRLAAIQSLGIMRDPQAMPYLHFIAERDPDPVLKKEAVAALGAIQKPR